MKIVHSVLVVSMLNLSACGTSKADRAATGGLLGAGAGAVVGSTVGAPVTGAVIGAGVGATAGAVTDPSQINLGKPLWR